MKCILWKPRDLTVFIEIYIDDDDFFIFILLSREGDGDAIHWANPDSLRICFCFQVFRLRLLNSLVCCLLDSTKQKYREASYPRKQQRG